MDDIEFKVGDYIDTPQFMRVSISEVFSNMRAAREAGYTEPIRAYIPGWDIMGIPAGGDVIHFAAVRK